MIHLASSDVAMQHNAATQHKSSVELEGQTYNPCGIRMVKPDPRHSGLAAAPV
jgi:hypothetical protein